jgi:2-polyprenyl-3-methyl-5-hydroxy-6-metoxy-1,4-benzoquinol methylase
MRLLFDLGMISHIRHFDSIVPELERRGHTVILNGAVNDGLGQWRFEIGETRDHRDVLSRVIVNRGDAEGSRAYQRRCARDYIQYLRPMHEGSEVLRARARNMLVLGYVGIERPEQGAALEALLTGLDQPGLDAVDRALAAAERALPPDPAVVARLRAMCLDAVLVTPLVLNQYGQTEIVKAARHLGLPVLFLAGSWDNLTTKGMIQVAPDRTLVWNEIQKREAVEIHGLAPESVEVVGAARFDAFQERQPDTSRETFLAELGLDPDQRTLVYLGSSNLIAASELDFIERWLAALRAHREPALARANVVLRPHPKFRKGWQEAFAGREGVAVSWSESMNDDPLLFHTLVHGDAVVAVNTSAELEAAVLRKPVFSPLDADFALGQGGTVHFGYLQQENGGFARTCRSMEELLEGLRDELANRPAHPEIEAFLASFIRPRGLERRATDVTVDCIERSLDALSAGRPAAEDYRTRLYESYFDVHVGPRKGKMDQARLEKAGRAFDRHFAALLPQDKEAAILDAGCGVGLLVNWLQARGYEKARGIDTSPDVVRMAQQIGIRNVERQDLMDLLGREFEAYDAIFMRDVLEHMPKEAVLRVLDGVFGLLKPGGRLILQVPNGGSPVVGRVLYGDFTHETAFTDTSLTQILRTCGFEAPGFKGSDPAREGVSLWHALTDAKARQRWRRERRIARGRRLVKALIAAETGQAEPILSSNLICWADKPRTELPAAAERAAAKRAKPKKRKAAKTSKTKAATTKTRAARKTSAGETAPGAVQPEDASKTGRSKPATAGAEMA